MFDPGISSRIPSSGATNNATVAKGSPGGLYGFTARNTNAAALYLKFFDKATVPDPAADTPVLTFGLLPSGAITAIMGLNFRFQNGISYAMVTGAADGNNAAIASGDVLGLNVICS